MKYVKKVKNHWPTVLLWLMLLLTLHLTLLI